MAKAINRLSQAFVNKTAAPGDYCDGNGLYLQITTAGVKSRLFRYMRQGRARYMGLGPLDSVGLSDARTRALECRRLLLDGLDPLDSKGNERAADLTAKAKPMTFDECASAYIEAHRAAPHLPSPMLDPENKLSPPELRIAYEAWVAVTEQGNPREHGRGVYESLVQWITDNKKACETRHKAKLGKMAIERIATVTNWNKTGGAAKTPER